MNNNEKAATYIGWKPDQQCGNTHSYNWWCEECGWRPVYPEKFHIHSIPAPDMNLPSNYMKAEVEWEIDTYQCTWSAYHNDKEGHGGSAVTALTNLWYVEHQG